MLYIRPNTYYSFVYNLNLRYRSPGPLRDVTLDNIVRYYPSIISRQSIAGSLLDLCTTMGIYDATICLAGDSIDPQRSIFSNTSSMVKFRIFN